MKAGDENGSSVKLALLQHVEVHVEHTYRLKSHNTPGGPVCGPYLWGLRQASETAPPGEGGRGT